MSACAAARSATGVPGDHRVADRGKPHRQVLEEQPNDVGHQFVVAGEPVPQRVLVERDRGRRPPSAAAAVAVLFDDGEQHRRIDRLREIAVHAGGQAPLAIAVHRVRRHGDDADVLARDALAHANRDGRVESAHDRHLQIHQHQVEGLALEPGQGLAAVLGDRHVMAAAGQQAGRDPLVDHVVLDEQDARAPAHPRPSASAPAVDFAHGGSGGRRLRADRAFDRGQQIGGVDRLGEVRRDAQLGAARLIDCSRPTSSAS